MHKLILFHARAIGRSAVNVRQVMYIDNFMELLTTYSSLKQLVLTSKIGVGFDTWAELSCEDRLSIAEVVADCYGGLTCFASEPFSVWMDHLARPASLLRLLIVDDLEASIHRDLVDKVVAGYPKLKDLEELKTVHVSGSAMIFDHRGGWRDFGQIIRHATGLGEESDMQWSHIAESNDPACSPACGPGA